jgi:polysaccharide biosynthesis/export protein
MNRWYKFAIQLAALVLGLTAAAFGQNAQGQQGQQGQNAQAAPPEAEQGSPDRPVLQHRNARYKVNRDDILTISFPLSPELNQKVSVHPDGYITLQSIGSVYIQGLTVPEVVDAVKKASAKVLNDPIVDVDLVDFQRPYFMVNGQVGKPGQYDLRHDTTVTEAIALAGGFLPTAKTQVFVYHRISTSWMEVKKMNLKDILNGKNANEDIQMQPGDMIFVPEKFIANFRKYVPYTVGVYANPQAFF